MTTSQMVANPNSLSNAKTKQMLTGFADHRMHARLGAIKACFSQTLLIKDMDLKQCKFLVKTSTLLKKLTRKRSQCLYETYQYRQQV